MLQLKNITKDYKIGNEKVHALRGVSIDFRESEFVSVLGQSGCGKTTILRSIAGLLQPTSGRITIGDKECTAPGSDRGMVFQDFALFPWRSVQKNVEFGMEVAGVPKEERRERAVSGAAERHG